MLYEVITASAAVLARRHVSLLLVAGAAIEAAHLAGPRRGVELGLEEVPHAGPLPQVHRAPVPGLALRLGHKEVAEVLGEILPGAVAHGKGIGT